MLKTLVTAQGTKVALPVTEISRLADLPLDAAQAILGRLDQPHRLVRPLLREQATSYELTHEIVRLRHIRGRLASQESGPALLHAICCAPNKPVGGRLALSLDRDRCSLFMNSGRTPTCV